MAMCEPKLPVIHSMVPISFDEGPTWCSGSSCSWTSFRWWNTSMWPLHGRTALHSPAVEVEHVISGRRAALDEMNTGPLLHDDQGVLELPPCPAR